MVQKGFTLWFTGLPCAGKTTLAAAIEKKFCAQGLKVAHLDGDVLRKEFSGNLGFSKKDRSVHADRVIARASKNACVKQIFDYLVLQALVQNPPARSKKPVLV